MGQNNRNTRRILHTSDLHLASLGDTACHSFKDVVNLAMMKKVDLVIIAGDLFDHHNNRDDLVLYVIEELQRLTMAVIILPGNHDCLMPGSTFARTELWQDYPNIQIFMDPRGETLDIIDLGLSLWGKPCISLDYDIRPLEGIPIPQDNSRWHIAVAHGYFVATDPPLFLSYHITKEEIATSSAYDYIALGHMPVFSCVCTAPMSCYSGSPSFSRTCVLVELSQDTGVRAVRCELNGEGTAINER